MAADADTERYSKPSVIAAVSASLPTTPADGRTLKRAGNEAEVADTIDRAGLWRAATPQVFRFGILTRSLAAAIASNRIPTDEAQAVEWAGYKPRLVAGRPDNIKVTTADDLALAAAILALQENS